MKSARTYRFSLLELIVVMVLLTIGTALVAPRLTGFFQGRRLDDEARRLWALSRFAREEAIRHAVPVRLWIDNENGQYGADSLPGYGHEMTPRTYDLPPHLSIFAVLTADAQVPEAALTWWPDGSLTRGSAEAIVVEDNRNPTDAWRLARQIPLPLFILERENAP